MLRRCCKGLFLLLDSSTGDLAIQDAFLQKMRQPSSCSTSEPFLSEIGWTHQWIKCILEVTSPETTKKRKEYFKSTSHLDLPACPVTKSAQCPLHLWEFGSLLENNYHQLSTSTICEKNMDSFIHQSKFSPLQHLHRQLCCHVVPWPLAPFYRNPAKNTNQSLEDVGRPTTYAAGNGELWPTKTIEVLKPAKLIKHGQTKQLPNVKSIKNGGKTSSHEV